LLTRFARDERGACGLSSIFQLCGSRLSEAVVEYFCTKRSAMAAVKVQRTSHQECHSGRIFFKLKNLPGTKKIPPE
jgi:hypothetical protein